MTTYALFIGIDRYGDRTIRNLRHAHRDAQELYGLFKNGLQIDRAALLDGDTGLKQVKSALNGIGSAVEAGDRFIFYYAGHGYWHPGKNDTYLLLPEARRRNVEAGHTDGEELLSLKNLKFEVDGWPDVESLFILDACRSALGEETARGAPETVFQGEDLLVELFPRLPRPARDAFDEGGTMVLNACGNGQAAFEPGEEGEGGLLRLALEAEIRQAITDGQPIVIDNRTPARLKAHIRNRWGKDSPQHPWLSPAEGRFVLARAGTKKSEAKPAIETPPAPPKPSSEPPPVSVSAKERDERNWRLAGLKDTAEAYEQYIQDALDGSPHVDEAFKKIEAKLTPSQVSTSNEAKNTLPPQSATYFRSNSFESSQPLSQDMLFERKANVVCRQNGVQYSYAGMEDIVGLELRYGFCKGVVLSEHGYEATSLEHVDAAQLAETISRVVESLEKKKGNRLHIASLALPVSAGQPEIKAAQDACRKAGLEPISVSFSPVLATLAIGCAIRNRRLATRNLDRTLAICDFGSHETSVALVEIATIDNEDQYEVWCVCGDRKPDSWVIEARRREPIESVAQRLVKFLHENTGKANYPHIDSICLIGELATIPQIKAAVESHSGLKVDFYSDQEHFAAIGAAIRGGVRRGRVRDVLLLDAYPFSIEIALQGGTMDQILPPNAIIPTMAARWYKIWSNDKQATTIQLMEVSMSRGTSVLIGSIDLTDIAFPESNSFGEIKVRVDIDHMLSIEVTVEDVLSGKITSHRIDNGTMEDLSHQPRYPLLSGLLRVN